MTISDARPKQIFGGKSPQPLEWKKPLPYMQEWLDNLAADEVSQTYISVARVGLIHLSNFCVVENLRHPDEFTRRDILHFQTYLTEVRKQNGDPFALSYRRQLMKYVRNWINWLERMKYIDSNPWVQIKVGSTAKLPKPLEDEEVALLFAAHKQQAFSIQPFFYHRREALLVLMYAWGLRIGELSSLNVVQMDGRLEFVTVRNKSRAGSANREKHLPYQEDIKLTVLRYLQHRSGVANEDETALFVDHSGKAMSSHLIRKMMTDLGSRAGVDVNPHRMRDTCATTLLDNGMPVELLMKMLGHSTREQTLAYSKVRDKRVASVHRQVVAPLLGQLLGPDAPNPEVPPQPQSPTGGHDE